MQKLSLTNKYSPYPNYKDSGVEWVGDVPETWEIAGTRRLFETKKDLALETDSQKVLSLTLRGVIPRILDGSGKNPANYDTYQEFKKEDLVFCLFDYDVTPRTIGLVDEDGMMTGAYTRLIPKAETSSKFFYYYFLYLDYTKELLHLCTGLRNSISKPVFWSLKNPLPAKEEQERIARFLDEQTTRIDETIAKKERLIKLLKEKRTAVINHVVTKGLDSNAALVDSGIDWLGKVNISFDIIKLRYLTKISTGSKDTANSNPDGEYPFFVRSQVIEKINSFSFDGEAVLTAGDGAGVGKVFHYHNGKLDYHQRVYLFSNFKKVIGKYFYYYLSSNLARVVLMGESKSTVDSIRMPQLLKLPFTVPKKEDQEKIVSYLDVETMKYDEILNRVTFSITKLQELKSSLISHAITGKIKI